MTLQADILGFLVCMQHHGICLHFLLRWAGATAFQGQTWSQGVPWHWVFLLCLSGWNLHLLAHKLQMLWNAEYLYFPIHSVEVPGIHSGHIQEMKEHSDVSLFVFMSVDLLIPYADCIASWKTAFGCFSFLLHLWAKFGGVWQEEAMWITELSNQCVTVMLSILLTTEQTRLPSFLSCFSLFTFSCAP